MTAGLGIFLIALGAIIRYAINVSIAGVEEGTIGLILILAGIAVLLLSLLMWQSDRRRMVTEERVADRPPPR